MALKYKTQFGGTGTRPRFILPSAMRARNISRVREERTLDGAPAGCTISADPSVFADAGVRND